MKKILALASVLAIVLAAGIFANAGMEKGGMMKDGMQGGMMWANADVKMENTADGVKIMVTSKDAKEVKEIQEQAKEMEKMREAMKSGKMEMDGMHGMMMNPEMMRHMQKKIGVIFGFLTVIWSLLIILLAVTIILVIKKIMAK